MIIPSLLLFIVFIVLGLIHFNWVFGGTLGLEHALPTNENGDRVLNPGKWDSAVVGVGLTVFGLFYLFRSGLVAVELAAWVVQAGGWVIPLIFIFRAIGDFKYVGFFKRIKKTTFGKADSKFFSPLCLIIGLSGILVQVYS